MTRSRAAAGSGPVVVANSHRRPLANRLTAWLLRSPFSGLLDGSLMLVTVRGRRTGAEYTIPVQYATDGKAIWVLPAHHERKTWWRNLTQERRVVLRLRGRDVTATARAFSGDADPAEVAHGLMVYAGRFPGMARRLGIAGKGDSTARLHSLAKRMVMVRVLPTDDGALLADAARTRDGTRGPLGWIRRHPLGAFYALTFLLSWGYWVPDAASGGHISHTPGLMGPMLAAFAVTGAVDGRAGLRDLVARMARWRVPVRWYLAAAAPLLVAIGAAAIVALGPGGFPSLAKWARMDGFPALGLLGTFALILVVNAFGEETGWRGFALPRFRRRHAKLEASFLLSIPWMLWHIPTFFLDTGYRGFSPLMIPGFALGIFAGAVVLTWLYEGARSSILIVALWHAFLNVGSATKAGEGAVQVAVTLSVIVWSLLIARMWRRAAETASATRRASASDAPST